MGTSEKDMAKERQRKVGTLVSAYIEQKAYNALLAHCEATGQSKTKAIERAIMNYCRDGTDDKSGKE